MRPKRLPYVPEFSPERLELRERAEAEAERLRKQEAFEVKRYLNNSPASFGSIIEGFGRIIKVILLVLLALVVAGVTIALYFLPVMGVVLWGLYYRFVQIPHRKRSYMRAYYAGEDPVPRDHKLGRQHLMPREEMDFWHRRYRQDLAKGLSPDPCRYFLPSRTRPGRPEVTGNQTEEDK